MNVINEQSKEAVAKIVADLTDRSGLENEWENIDEATQKEIIDAWEEIVAHAMDIIRTYVF